MMIDGTRDATREGARRSRTRPAGRPSKLGTAGKFALALGSRIDARSPSGYYIDLRSKADTPDWPPPWYEPGAPRPHVVIMQWGLGCHERFLAGEGEHWLAGALGCADHLVATQERDGRQAGGWVQHFPYKHTYRISPPWLSGMAQGEGASLLVRVHRATGDDRYADAALRALEPMRVPVESGGVAAKLEGGVLPQEYPTQPASHVLNGAIFALWGPHDVAAALGDDRAGALAREGIETLASAIHRFDTGYWSWYDLYPHPVRNIASPFYHRLHIEQLRALTAIDPDPRFSTEAIRFEAYRRSRLNIARAYSRKILFRIAVPRNKFLARRLPWTGGGR